MTCQDCLAAFAAGNFLARRAARRHAAHCPACAQAIAALEGLKQQLAAAEPLSASQRDRWMTVARVEPAMARPRRVAMIVALGGAAAAVLIAIGIWIVARPRNANEAAPRESSPVVATSQGTTLRIEPDPAIRGQLLQLSEQLDRLAREAALLDEREDVRLLSERAHNPSTEPQP